MAAERRIGGFACALALMMTAGVAAAACLPTPPSPVATTPAMTPLVDRFTALVADDPYLLTARTAPRWQMLVDDLTRAGAPADLLARGELMLAGSLQGDEVAARSLAVARDGLARAEASGITDGSLHAALLTIVATREVETGSAPKAVVDGDAALAQAGRADGEESWAYGMAAQAAAAAHHATGDYLGAERLSAIASRLAAACLPPDTPIIGWMMQSHAATLDTLGRSDEALAEGERAVVWDVAHLPESDVALAEALEAVGFALRNANRLHEAEAVMRRALDLDVRYRPDDAGPRASTTGKLARILSAQGKDREAEALFLAAQQLYARARGRTNPLAGSGEMRRAADAAQAQGKVDEALDLRRRAIALIETRVQPRHPELARARLEYAATLAVAGRAREGLAIAEPAVAVLRETAPPGDSKRMNAEITYALVAGAAGVDPGAAYAAAAPVAAKMEAALLDQSTSRGELGSLAPTFARSFAVTARVALAAHDEEAAFHALQLADLSGIVLAEADAAARRAAADPAIRNLIERLDASTRDRLRLDRDRVAANAQGDTMTVTAVDAAIGRGDAEHARLALALERRFPAYRTLSRPRPVTLGGYRARLDPDEVLIAPLSLPGEAVVIAVTRDGLTWASVAAPRPRVTALVARLRESIDASRRDPRARFDTAAARALAAIVLPAALAPVLATHRHLVYYASGSLATVPPALLVTAPPQRGTAPAWLIRSHAVSIATTLSRHADADRAPRDGFLGVGAPLVDDGPPAAAIGTIAVAAGEFGEVGTTGLPPLPDAARELRSMGRLFPADRRRLLIGAAATKPALRALSLDRYGVIAFATHGLVADALPGLTQPALVLTPAVEGGVRHDGLLTAGDIAALHVDADWVILSACDTAGGSDPESGSYSGLASAFVKAGARALLVSQWPVRDDAAGRITVATLVGTRRGLDRASALRRAMLALMRDRRVVGSANPAIWAPFVLIDR